MDGFNELHEPEERDVGERDFCQEAMNICDGSTMMLATREHLLALRDHYRMIIDAKVKR